MLHDYHGIALVTKVFERRDQAIIVSLVQANRRLVEYVEHAHEACADLGRQPYALRLSP